MEFLPDEVSNLIKEFAFFKPNTKKELRKAVDLWCENKDEALNKYGHISNWNTSLITDMSGLFYDEAEITYFDDLYTNPKGISFLTSLSYNNNDNSDSDGDSDSDGGSYVAPVNYKEDFNDNINNWDVSNVKTMCGMFINCKSFNQALDKWNVSKVEEMDLMFRNCTNFDQPLNDWITSNVKTMYGMFNKCSKFNQPLNKWNVSKVEDMERMFRDCKIFDQLLNSWDTSSIIIMVDMFKGASLFDKNNALWY